MIAAFVPMLLATVLIVSALAGPWLVRRAAPMLMRVPRTAVAVLISGVVLWLLSVASVSLMLAWIVTGPSILPLPAADVCRRCLAAASPFGGPGVIETAIPAALLVALPAFGALLAAALGIRRSLAARRQTRAISREVLSIARPRVVRGHPVLLLDDERPVAFSLPRRAGGVVISGGLLTALSPEELDAVLAHEREHLRGRHHLLLALLDAVTVPLRWVPLAGAVAQSVPHYLEIAADDAARRQTGTPALAGALLKLGDPDRVIAGPHARPALRPVLHAAGPDRIGHLIRPSRVGPALLPAAALGLLVVAFSTAAVAVHGPYLSVLLTGCRLPMM